MEVRDNLPDRKQAALVEAALFMAGRPMGIKELSEAVGLERKTVMECLRGLMSDYSARGSALEIFVNTGEDSASMRVADEYLSRVRDLSTLTDISDGEKKTLAVVAFYQPIRQSEVVKIRGNRAYHQLRKLEGTGLVRAEPKGVTKLLTTTQKFTEYFGGRQLEEIKESLKRPSEKPAKGGPE